LISSISRFIQSGYVIFIEIDNWRLAQDEVTLSTVRVSVGYRLGIGWVSVGYRLGIGWVSVGCRLGVGWVSVGCRLGARWVWVNDRRNSPFLFTIFQLLFPWIANDFGKPTVWSGGQATGQLGNWEVRGVCGIASLIGKRSVQERMGTEGRQERTEDDP
jgi:hypothetical protein